MSNVQDARREMTKTKEQLEEEKKISLSIRIKPLELDGKICTLNSRRAWWGGGGGFFLKLTCVFFLQKHRRNFSKFKTVLVRNKMIYYSATFDLIKV